MKQLLVPLPVLLILLPGCKKDDPDPASQLPAATQTGANTAGCLINGQAFVAAGRSTGLLSGPIKALYGGFAFGSIYYLQINGQVNGVNTAVSLYFYSPKTGAYPKAGAYFLDKKTQYYPQGIFVFNHATYVNSNSNEVYVTDAQHTGQVNLTVADMTQRLSAGMFEFTAASELDPSKTVTITSGRFDRKQ